MRVAWLAVVCALVAANATGQDVHRVPAPAADAASEVPLAHSGTSSSVFRSAVDLVALNVVVTDRAQQFVTGLTSADFTVLEDGVPQELSLFAARDVPLDLAHRQAGPLRDLAIGHVVQAMREKDFARLPRHCPHGSLKPRENLGIVRLFGHWRSP